MKLRLLICLGLFVGIIGGLDLARGEITRSSKLHALPQTLLKGSGTPSPLLAAARPPALPAPTPQSPPLGPSPVSYLSASVFAGNGHDGNNGIEDMAFGDFNGDGKKDIVAVDSSSCVSVFPGDGKGGFGIPIDSCVLPSNGGGRVVAGDFNNDGILDVAVVSGNGNIMLAQGNGDGTFTYVTSLSVTVGEFGGTPLVIRAADLNGDGNLDLVLGVSFNGGDPSPNYVDVFLGDGKFGFAMSQVAGRGNCPTASGLVIADFNHDGIPDLAVTNPGCGVNDVEISIGKGDGTFQAVVGYPTSTQGPGPIAAGHFHSAPDGIIDLAVITGSGGTPLTTFLGNGDGTFQEPNLTSTTVYNPNNLAVGDFNTDGVDDVIVSSNYEANGDFVGVQLGNGDGTFGAPGTPGFTQYAVLSSPTSIFVLDLNGDGFPDFVTLSSGSESFCVSLGSGSGEGSGGFLAGVDDYAGPGVFGQGAVNNVVAADFNQDGKLDYATAGNDRNFAGVNISIGDGEGNFAAPVHYNVGNPVAITTGNFVTNNLFPDIAVVDQSNKTVSVLLNNGDGTFASPVGYAVGAGGGYIQSADFNRDGNMDLIVSNVADNSVSVLLGNGDGTFQPQIVSSSGGGSYLAVGDFNGDGKPDVVIGTYSPASYQILFGNGDGTFQSPTTVSLGPVNVCGVAVGDFNKDGKLDLAICEQLINNGSNGYGGVAILLGNGDGTFQAQVQYPTVPVGLNGNPVTFGTPRIADLNNDGNLDIVVPNQNAYAGGQNLGPAILLGNGDGTFVLNPAKPAITGLNEADIAIGDFNSDGFLDLVVQGFDPGGFDDAVRSTATILLSSSSSAVFLRSAPNPSAQGQNVIFTASVASGFTGLPTPTGTITFEIGSTHVTVPLVNDVATYETTTLPAGSIMVFAQYSGDANYNPITSLGLTQTVTPGPLTITTTSLPNAVQNVSYTGAVSASGGTPPYSFSLSNGSNPLPAGLTLNGDGSITGKATGAPGTSSFSVQVQDSESPAVTATAGLSITVSAGTPASIAATSGTPQSATVSTAFVAPLAATVTDGSGNPVSGVLVKFTAPTSGASGSFAGGVNSAATNASGVATSTTFTANATAGSYTVTASVVGIGGTANFSLTNIGALTITTTSLPNGVQGVPYSQGVNATGGFGAYTFSISAGSLPAGLAINPSTGVISGPPTSAGTSSFTVQVKDSGTPQQTATANLSITITSTLEITTSGLPNGVVGTFYSATVAASGGATPYTFSISSGSLPAGLSIDPSGGSITGTPAGPAATSNFTVQVKDSSAPVNTATANLSIAITGSLSISTPSLPAGIVGTPYSASLAALGGTPPYSFSIVGGKLPGGLSPNGSTISGTPTAAGKFNFTIQVADSSSPVQKATATASITISGSLQITTTSLPPAISAVPSIFGAPSYTAPINAQGGVGPYTWSLIGGSMPPGFGFTILTTLGPTVQITGPTTNLPVATYAFEIQLTDSAGDTATANLSITVNPAFQITTTSLPTGTVGIPYSASISATGGTPPYTFTPVSISPLPAGLSLSPSGVVSGTPTAPLPGFVASFLVNAKDSSSPPQALQFATIGLTILPSAPVAITTTSLPNGSVNNSYSAGVAASGGAAPYTFTITSGLLPAGLTFNKGVIAGKPTVAGTSTFTVQVADSSKPAQTASTTLSITVTPKPVPLSITTAILPKGVVSQAYDAPVVATGGNGTYTFTITGGSLPGQPGELSMNSSGVISGTPSTTGTSSFTVQVQDTSSPVQTATKTLSLTVVPKPVPLTIITKVLPGGTMGTAYSANVAASGGVTPYTFSTIVGSLPPGLNLDTASGQISGPPTAAGTFGFIVQVQDSEVPSQTTSASLSITISATKLKIVGATLPTAAVTGLTFYSAPITVSGGTPPYALSVSSGSLPPGTDFLDGGPTGEELYGVLTAAGTFNFTVQVQDSGGQTASANFSLTVNGGLTLTNSPPNGIVGTLYNFQFAATGGLPPYTFSATGLPSGLAMTPKGLITGKPTVASPAFSMDVTLTDSAGTVVPLNLFNVAVYNKLQLLPTLPNASTHNSYAAPIPITGGGPIPFTITMSGSLPPGLTFQLDRDSLSPGDPVVGAEIDGTPTAAGAFTFTVTVTDSGVPSQTVTKTYTLTVVDGVFITTTSLPPMTLGASYSTEVSAVGGTPPYTFSPTPTFTINGVPVPDLPPGLIITSGGTIEGTPTASSLDLGNGLTTTYTAITVNVTDSSKPARTSSAVIPIVFTN